VALAIDPLAYLAIPILIIGITSTFYLLSAREQTQAARYLAGALAAFSGGMAAKFAEGIVLWGGALEPLPEALAALAMAGVVAFAYHYPQRPRGRPTESTVVTAVAMTVAVGALAYSIAHAVRFLSIGRYVTGLEGAYHLIIPLAYVAALFASVRRTLEVHRGVVPRQRGESLLRWSRRVFRHPSVPTGRVLRDFSVAIAFGTIQAVASLLTTLGWLGWPWHVYWIALPLLTMVLFIVSSVLEHVGTPAGIEGKLVGLALTISLAVLGLVGIVLSTESIADAVGEHYRRAANVQSALGNGAGTLAAPGIAHVICWPSGGDGAAQVLYPAATTALTRLQARPNLPAPAWQYSTEIAHATRARARESYRVVSRYGDNDPGTYHDTLGLQFAQGGMPCEVGFSLSDAEAPIRRQGVTLILLVLLSSVMVGGAFRYVIRVHITRPLHDLVRGVAQANTGTYDVIVPISYPDDIGYLSRSFNQLTRSIATEILERRAAEAQVRSLNTGLEMQVASRTRELAALYDIAEVASQAMSQDALLQRSLAYVTAALGCEAGAVYLASPAMHGQDSAIASDPRDLLCVAQAGQRQLPLLGRTVPAGSRLAERVQLGAPWLVRDVTTAPEVAEFGLRQPPASMLCLPLAVEEVVLGLALILGRTGHIFDLNEIALAASMADQIAIGLQATRLRDRATVLEERERIARDLHDSAIQALYGLVTLTGAASLQLDQSDVKAAHHTLERISDTGRQAIREIRLFIHNLNPPALEEQGLIGALHHRLATVEGRANIEARLLADSEIDLPLRTQRCFYQIAQEALNNTLKHAHAAHVTVYLSMEGEAIAMEILDDGDGFDPIGEGTTAGGGMGLRNMQQRSEDIGAEFRITSAPGHGTRVRVTYDQGR